MVPLFLLTLATAADVGVLVVDPNSIFKSEALRREVNATLTKIAPDATVLARTLQLDAACLQVKKSSITHCRGDLPDSVGKLYIIDFTKGSKAAEAETVTLLARHANNAVR